MHKSRTHPCNSLDFILDRRIVRGYFILETAKFFRLTRDLHKKNHRPKHHRVFDFRLLQSDKMILLECFAALKDKIMQFKCLLFSGTNTRIFVGMSLLCNMHLRSNSNHHHRVERYFIDQVPVNIT